MFNCFGFYFLSITSVGEVYPCCSYLYFFWYIINLCRMIILPSLLFSCQGSVRVSGSYVIHRHHCRLLLLCTCSDTLFSFIRDHTSTNDLFGLVLPPGKAIVVPVNKNLPFLMGAEGSLPCIILPKERDSFWHMGH